MGRRGPGAEPGGDGAAIRAASLRHLCRLGGGDVGCGMWDARSLPTQMGAALRLSEPLLKALRMWRRGARGAVCSLLTSEGLQTAECGSVASLSVRHLGLRPAGFGAPLSGEALSALSVSSVSKSASVTERERLCEVL